jgi:hypothetical protein
MGKPWAVRLTATTVALATLAAAASAASATSPHARSGPSWTTILADSAEGARSADVSGSTVTVRRPKYRSVRVRVTEAATTAQPYTYGANYDKVLGAVVTVLSRVSGTVTATCNRSKPYGYEYTRKSFTAAGATLRLPLRRADTCKVAVSITADPPDFPGGSATIMGTRIAFTVVTVK